MAAEGAGATGPPLDQEFVRARRVGEAAVCIPSPPRLTADRSQLASLVEKGPDVR